MTIHDIVRNSQNVEMDEKWLRRTCLTPRSQEAFRMSGILPQEIIYPKLEHFYDPTQKYGEEIAEVKL